MVANETEGKIVVGRIERLKTQAPTISVVKRVILLNFLANEINVAIAVHVEAGHPDCEHVIDQSK